MLRDELLLHTHQQAAHRIAAGLRAAGEHTFLHLLQRVDKLRDRRALRMEGGWLS